MVLIINQKLLLIILFSALGSCIAITIAYMVVIRILTCSTTAKKMSLKEDGAHPFAWRTRMES